MKEKNSRWQSSIKLQFRVVNDQKVYCQIKCRLLTHISLQRECYLQNLRIGLQNSGTNITAFMTFILYRINYTINPGIETLLKSRCPEERKCSTVVLLTSHWLFIRANANMCSITCAIGTRAIMIFVNKTSKNVMVILRRVNQYVILKGLHHNFISQFD